MNQPRTRSVAGKLLLIGGKAETVDETKLSDSDKRLVRDGLVTQMPAGKGKVQLRAVR